MVCSGIRLGTPALTTRGMGNLEMNTIAELITSALSAHGDNSKLKRVADEVRALSSRFPLYKHRLVG